MSDKPADISQDVWDAAEAIMNSVGYYSPHDFSVMVATEIMAAKAEERAAKDAIIAELREALERIAFEGVDDREKLMRSALDYVNTGGRYPNERTIAAAALSKASQD